MRPYASVAVGLEPIAVAARNAAEVWVVNHLSDSVSVVDVGPTPPRVRRTLLVGDEPGDVVFAGPDRRRAFVTAAHRGQNAKFDPQFFTPGVGRADVWVYDADNLGNGLGGQPLTVLTLFGDTPRALAVSPDGKTVYASVFRSGNRTTVVPEGAIPEGAMPLPTASADGVPAPTASLVVKHDVFFSGLGFSELAIDGNKVGDYVIGPGCTTYNKRAQYLAFDVTDRFNTTGAHQLDVTLSDGWYGLSHDPWVHGFQNRAYVDKPKLLLNLHLQHSDGTETVVVSDASWKCSLGEITRSWIVQEDIDLRQQSRNWKPVAVVKGPAGRLVCQKEPPNRIVNEAKPVSFSYDAATKSATWDFGREINGCLRFRASGPAGTKLTITTMAVGAEGVGAPGFPSRPARSSWARPKARKRMSRDSFTQACAMRP